MSSMRCRLKLRRCCMICNLWRTSQVCQQLWSIQPWQWGRWSYQCWYSQWRRHCIRSDTSGLYRSDWWWRLSWDRRRHMLQLNPLSNLLHIGCRRRHWGRFHNFTCKGHRWLLKDSIRCCRLCRLKLCRPDSFHQCRASNCRNLGMYLGDRHRHL